VFAPFIPRKVGVFDVSIVKPLFPLSENSSPLIVVWSSAFVPGATNATSR
jgi:hypothetical protein